MQNARRNISEGYYAISDLNSNHKRTFPSSLKKTILDFNHASIITEIKRSSPSLGIIRNEMEVDNIASLMQKSGAIAISVLTEPKYFQGSLTSFIKVREQVALPLLMKDIVISPAQIDLASIIGADAILLIKALFDRGHCVSDLYDMIAYAHSKRLEVLLETHTIQEFSSALNTDADLIGINNRDLRTLTVDLNTTRTILQQINPQGKVVVSESGIKNPSDIRFLHQSGAQAFLIGSAIMMAQDIEVKIRELVMAL
jgi:indole-3-glycerol phosphate synthase